MSEFDAARWSEIFIIVWVGVVVLHGLWSARDRSTDPAEPVEPDPHHH